MAYQKLNDVAKQIGVPGLSAAGSGEWTPDQQTPAAQRQPEMLMILGRFEEHLKALMSVVGALESRLSPVSRPMPVDPKGNSKPEQEFSSPVGQQLSGGLGVLADQTIRLHILLERLEI